MVENGIDATVFELDTAVALSKAATRLDGEARIHLKIDTGMGRIGLNLMMLR